MKSKNSFKLFLDNIVISFCKWFTGARKITLVYKPYYPRTKRVKKEE